MDQPRFRLRVGFQRACVAQLRAQFGLLLVRRIVAAGQQARFRAKILDPGFRLRNLLAQIFDFARQPLAGGFGLLRPRVLRQPNVGLGDRIGDARRELRIARLEFDYDDGRFVERVSAQTVEIGI